MSKPKFKTRKAKRNTRKAKGEKPKAKSKRQKAKSKKQKGQIARVTACRELRTGGLPMRAPGL